MNESIAKLKREASATEGKMKLVYNICRFLTLHEANNTCRGQSDVGDVVLFHVPVENAWSGVWYEGWRFKGREAQSVFCNAQMNREKKHQQMRV